MLLAVSGCGQPPVTPPIVGTWMAKDAAAPFPWHLYVFNADGTMQQANPDAGHADSSDSDGKGIWVADGDRVKGKFVEITADRATHRFSGRGEISFDLKVTGNRFVGSASARFFDVEGKLVAGPIPDTLAGQRVVLD